MKNHVHRHDHIKGAAHEWYRLIQISFALLHEPVSTERSSTGVPRSDCFCTHVNAATLAPDMTYNEGQRPAGSTTEIEQTACARELEPGNVFLKFVCGQPRVLADVFPVGFAPELVPQGRIKLFIKVVIVPVPGFYRNGHVHLINPFRKCGRVAPASRVRVPNFESSVATRKRQPTNSTQQ